MRTQTIKFVSALALIASFGLLTMSCAGHDEGSTPINKGGSGNGNGSQKPDEKAIQAALTDRVLLQIDKKSALLAASDKDNVIKVFLRLKVNLKTDISFWRPEFTLAKGEEKAAVACAEEYCDLGDENLKLSVTPMRLAKADNPDSLGYLVLKFELKREEEQNQLTKKAYLVVLIDLDRVKNPKAFIANEVIYPVKDFSLNDWIDKKLKQP